MNTIPAKQRTNAKSAKHRRPGVWVASALCALFPTGNGFRSKTTRDEASTITDHVTPPRDQPRRYGIHLSFIPPPHAALLPPSQHLHCPHRAKLAASVAAVQIGKRFFPWISHNAIQSDSLNTTLALRTQWNAVRSAVHICAVRVQMYCPTPITRFVSPTGSVC